jgi:hypothetical protein
MNRLRTRFPEDDKIVSKCIACMWSNFIGNNIALRFEIYIIDSEYKWCKFTQLQNVSHTVSQCIPEGSVHQRHCWAHDGSHITKGINLCKLNEPKSKLFSSWIPQKQRHTKFTYFIGWVMKKRTGKQKRRKQDRNGVKIYFDNPARVERVKIFTLNPKDRLSIVSGLYLVWKG